MNICSTRKVTRDVIRSLAVIGASVSLLAGCIRNPKVAADQPIPVQIRAPHRLHEPSSVAASGSVEANVTAQTAFQIGGRVARVLAEEGQFVKQGQVLAELDCSDYRNAFDAAFGQSAAAEANAMQAKNGVRAQELEQARVDFERAKDQYERNKYLYDHQSLPAIDFHQIEAA
jgi:multidrug efflux pump subunit AcrA (membrane-fusion protein)